MDTATTYRATVEATEEQRRLLQMRTISGDRWAARAGVFRADPRRELDANLAILASYIEPEDVVIDVGGGAGRHSLPLALRCREVVNVEPSAAMRHEFMESAGEAGIENVLVVPENWPIRDEIDGDVVLVANVTYFVANIVPFVEALVRAARRQVMITVWSVPPPARHARLFELVFGEPQAMPASYRELLPVLWDMGILPDVRVLPDARPLRGDIVLADEDEAVRHAIEQVDADDLPGAEERFREHLDQLFRKDPDGYRPAWQVDSREMLITWTTG